MYQIEADLNGREKIGWKRILIFFVIATALSNVFRFDVFELRPDLQQLPPWLFILLSVLLEGSGVLIGALVALFFLKKRRTRQISLLGLPDPKAS